jgi:hypothetical protein
VRQGEHTEDPIEQQAFETGIDAYVYGYPLVTMEMTRRVMTNMAAPQGRRAPMGQLANATQYPTPAFRDVTAPNADTLYSSAWIDLSKEPYGHQRKLGSPAGRSGAIGMVQLT